MNIYMMKVNDICMMLNGKNEGLKDIINNFTTRVTVTKFIYIFLLRFI